MSVFYGMCTVNNPQLKNCHPPLAGFRGTPIAPLVWIEGNISGGGRFLANLPASFEWTFVHNNVVIVLKTNCHSQFSIIKTCQAAKM